VPMYPKARQAYLSGQVNLLADDVRAVLVTAGAFAYDPTHEFLAAVPVGARLSTTAPLSSVSVTNGILNCADFQFSSVPGPAQGGVVVFYQNKGSDALSRLLLHLGEYEAVSGLPCPVNGNNVLVSVHPFGVFAL
jgi:hypothetical protein